MTVELHARVQAPGFPDADVRRRARHGVRAVFPWSEGTAYGQSVFGETADAGRAFDALDTLRLVPPILMPERLEKLIELGREPYHGDVELRGTVGGFRAALPVYVSAMGSTAVAHGLGLDVARQAGQAGVPLVLGENVRAVHGYERRASDGAPSFKERALAYVEHLPDGVGGLVVQQSTEDANAELWNQVYSDHDFRALVGTGRLGFELKLGQGAKGSLGGLTLLSEDTAQRLSAVFAFENVGDGEHLRTSAPGTFTAEILRSQVRLMANNYPDARIWVKLPPGRDVRLAAQVAWEEGAHAVCVDAACGGSALAPTALLQHLGLPLDECLRRLDGHDGALLVSGRIWEGSRAVKALAAGADAVGIGRAALLAANEDAARGFVTFLEAMSLEMQLLIAALGKYSPAALSRDDLWP